MQGYYRRGDAHFALGKYKDALKDFKSAARLAPRDPDLRKKLAACEKEVKRKRFEEALATPVSANDVFIVRHRSQKTRPSPRCCCKFCVWSLCSEWNLFSGLVMPRELYCMQDVPQTPPAETIDLASMTVEDSYDGPHLQGQAAHECDIAILPTPAQH